MDTSLSTNMAAGGNELAALLKPGPFKFTKVGDPEQTLLDWQEYIERFKRFLEITKFDGDHAEEHQNCQGCKTAKNILIMFGQKDMETLWKHVGKVTDEDNFEAALKKIEEGITGQTNQAVSRHKLFTKMNQGDKDFASWFVTIREQAMRCNFENYNADTATRDAILFQTSDTKLQREILSKDLYMDATIKAGLALEQSKMKQEIMTVSKQIEDSVRALSTRKKEENSQS